MENYKVDILETRRGHLGSSDAKMLSQIATLGNVPKSAYKRLAVAKGLIEHEESVSTQAMRFGDEIEQSIYEHLHSQDSRYESNPCWVSEKYSRTYVKCLSHPDIVLKDYDNKTLSVYEVKTSKKSIQELRYEYAAQLYHHTLLAKEFANGLGNGWKVKVYLVHYDTNGINMDEKHEFDTNRLSIHNVQFRSQIFDLVHAMDIVNTFMASFDYYVQDDVVDAQYLPMEIKGKFLQIVDVLNEIKERETKVEEFKRRLYDFMEKNGIKKVSNESFLFTAVAPTKLISTDYKELFEQEIESKKPRVARKMKEKYTKVKRRNGYVMIKIKDND